MIVPKTPTLIYAVAGLRAAVVPRDCATIPSTANPATLSAVYNVVLTRNVSDRVLLATFETAWIESHVNALNCGDQDSVGVFQQRPSQGWGTVAQCTDVQYSTTSFLNAAIANDRKYPRYTPGQIAQSVQYSEFPDRYDQAESIAKNLIAQAQRQAGMPVSTPALSASTSAPVPIISSSGTTLVTTSAPLMTSSGMTTSTSTAFSTATSTQQPVSSSNPAASLPSSTTSLATSSTTTKATSPTTKRTSTTTTKKSSTSTKKASTSSTKKMSSTTTKKPSTSSTKKTTSTTSKISTSKSSSTTNGMPNSSPLSSIFTTASATSTSSVAQSTPTLAPGTLDATCGALYEAASGDSCASLGKTFDATFAQLRFWNPSINAQCTNLIAGDVYCVASQVAVPPPSAASGINTNACTGYTTPVQSGQTCTAVAQQYGVSANRLVQLNKSLNAACTNILVGKSYCVTSIGS